ncbi:MULTISPECIES: helix-turn-helix domain-containing protein [unclassified Tenacibaculum]|uniref:helix-turn-helix domain-containing protein n=1 Tax=unclassified Tenacibaculum TaxID=2635139 RepID=UPI001F467BAC|nr:MULTISPECIES: helix-turn-helix transcriptional regulator [unclassified Tenacibaculum]MCF2873937.1 helix-turn-helix domain-containing protein [Tenacibaculum sp. Cn5-1]MCF2934518.1 helix-turn-helix domain-containing protein [Tenacibaculum sp. Cn5-34]MCG7510728.1 helix-turn-helix domain-containing protein [Tenacibaculum sp. Cn5-46]
MDENIKIITENIRLERLRKGISQDKMANLLQISQNAYSKIESGKTTLTIIRLHQIAKVLEISFEKLFLG